MNIPPALLFPHITIEEINSLTTDEKDLLLMICNIWAPIRPPMPSIEDPYPISLNMIRSTRKECILDRIIKAEKVITDLARPIYIELRKKLSIPLEIDEEVVIVNPEVVNEVVKEEVKSESIIIPSIIPPTELITEISGSIDGGNNDVTGSFDINSSSNVSGSI